VSTAHPAMQSSTEETLSWPRDPLLYFVDFPFRVNLYPFGFALELTSNSLDVIAAAQQSCGPFPKLHDAETIHLRIGVSETGAGELPQPPVIRGRRDLITIISDAANFGVCDVTGGFAFGWVTPAVAANSAFFRYHFLDLMTGLLLAPIHFAIVHAACVALNGHGVLLCGHSRAGKSTLSFACAQRGWTFISDDASHALRKNGGRTVIGNPLYLRLREDAPALFPQLRERAVVLRQNGEFGFEIPTATLPGFATAFQCGIDHAVFLNRRPAGPATITPFPRDEALRRLENVLEYTFACKPSVGSRGQQEEMALANPEAREEQKASIGELLTAGVYELCYSDLDSAVDCLESLVRSGS